LERDNNHGTITRNVPDGAPVAAREGVARWTDERLWSAVFRALPEPLASNAQ
jgi:hypothetical protein